MKLYEALRDAQEDLLNMLYLRLKAKYINFGEETKHRKLRSSEVTKVRFAVNQVFRKLPKIKDAAHYAHKKVITVQLPRKKTF
jgi:hypothetical protein